MDARIRTTLPALAALCALACAAIAEASPPAPAASAAAPARPAAARRLEDIHIEGEIPVPQVLFVTGRDQRRFLDFQHRRYMNASAASGRGSAAPTWIRVVDTNTATHGGNR
jgi:hypothetical protein